MLLLNMLNLKTLKRSNYGILEKVKQCVNLEYIIKL